MKAIIEYWINRTVLQLGQEALRYMKRDFNVAENDHIVLTLEVS